MDDSKLRFGVGVLVIAAIGIAVILTFLFGAFPAILNREYTITVFFDSAEGINTNTAVLRDGVQVGRVDDIQLQDEGGVLLTLSMDEKIRMTHRYIPQIGMGSFITGDSKLEFRKATERELAKYYIDRGDEDLIDQPYTDKELFKHGQKATDPFQLLANMEEDLVATFRSVGNAGDSIQGIGSKVEGLIDDVRAVIGVPSSTSNPAQPALQATPMSFRQTMSAAPSWARPVVWKVGHQSLGPDQGFVVQAAAFQPPGTPPSFANPNAFPMQQEGDGPATITRLFGKAEAAVADIQGLTQDIRGFVSDERLQKGIIDSVEKAPVFLDTLTQTLQNADALFDEIEGTANQFREVGRLAEETLSQTAPEIEATLKSVRSSAQSFEGTAKNVEAFTEPLGERSEEIVDSFLVTLNNVDNALLQITELGRMINNSDGTVKRLLDDDELYFQIQRTMQNFEAASARFRPILDDVRVFSDKIARDPRQLGVRGAITNRPNGMGLK